MSSSATSSVDFKAIKDPRQAEQQRKQENPLQRFICNTDKDKVGKINQHYDNEIKKYEIKFMKLKENLVMETKIQR